MLPLLLQNTLFNVSFQHSFPPRYISSFPDLKMPSLRSNINSATVEQRGLKQNQSEILFTLVEGRPTMVEIARLFGESGKINHCIHGTTMPRDKDNNLVTIHQPAMDSSYAKV